MATAPPTVSAAPRRLRAWRILLLPALAAAGLLAGYWPSLSGYARLGSAYGARVACACRYIAGRALRDCGRDLRPGMELVMLSEDAEGRSVTARVIPLASATATYRPGWGCLLEPRRAPSPP